MTYVYSLVIVVMGWGGESAATAVVQNIPTRQECDAAAKELEAKLLAAYRHSKFSAQCVRAAAIAKEQTP